MFSQGLNYANKYFMLPNCLTDFPHGFKTNIMTFDYIDTLLSNNVVIGSTKICLLTLTRSQNLAPSIDTSNAVHKAIWTRCLYKYKQ